jgi:N-acetylglutamate synthase-like GNAT family acetyltransferase
MRTLTPIKIRPAIETDEATIKAMVRAARLIPTNLHWSRFLVAEEGGRIVGMRQIKVHKRGTREVASGMVLLEYRRRGLSARLMHALLDHEHGPLYLRCKDKWEPYYKRFGFRRVEPSELPADLRKDYRIQKFVIAVRFLFARRKPRFIPMKRDGHRAWPARDDLETPRQTTRSRKDGDQIVLDK